ncbi:MAG TPA: hypothetical protein VF759_11045 [Allosphingosinicella sp.]|jgi:hypothetical protein
MADSNEAFPSEAEDLSDFLDSEPFWVIWQASLPGGRNRIRRISQDYSTAARAEADAERYRRSGAVTWVEEARPLAPRQVPEAALEALRSRPASGGAAAATGGARPAQA